MRYELERVRDRTRSGTTYQLRDQRGKRVPGSYINVALDGAITTHQDTVETRRDWWPLVAYPALAIGAFVVGVIVG